MRMVNADAVIAAIRNANCPCGDDSECRGCLIDDAIDVIDRMAGERTGPKLIEEEE